MSPPVFFTTETIVRELDWQLLAASRLARNGVTSLVGKLSALETAAAHSSGGLVVGRVFYPTFPDVDLRSYRALRKRGFAFVHFDEEGAVFQGDEARWRRTLTRRLDVRLLAHDDMVCTWGRFQAEHYRSRIVAASRGPQIVVTGHPRFDLYRPEARPFFAEALQRVRSTTRRPFVLVNTNVSIANHGLGQAYAFSARAGYDRQDAVKRADHLEHWAYATRVLVGLVKLAHRISVARPDLDVIVRPHPSEGMEVYQIILDGLPNVRVTRAEVVGAWLAGAVAVVQHGCTTALEAAVAGVPVIDFRAAEDPRYDKRLPDAIAVPCHDEDAVLAALADPESTARAGRSQHAWAPELFANLEGPALPRVVQTLLAHHAGRSGSMDEAGFRRARRWDRAWERAKRVAVSASPRHRRQRAYTHGKFTGFDARLVAARVRQLQAIGEGARIELVDSELLLVRPESPGAPSGE